MATPATLNTWLDELSSSILKNGTSKQNEKRLQDTFRRRVKRHNNNRTNQFEVVERLNGLEEKFQILTLDNLSDALHERRLELKQFEHHWLPDILDFFLHLSGDPCRNENLLEVYRIPPRIATPPPLRWKDILADDPIDRHDRLWRIPDFRDTDDSGYDDDESDLVSSQSSPDLKKQRSVSNEYVSRERVLQPMENLTAKSRLQGFLRPPSLDRVSETNFIREMLFVLRGYPTELLSNEVGKYKLKDVVRVPGISSAALRALTERVSRIRQATDLVKSWIAKTRDYAYLEAMKNAAESIMDKYNVRIDVMQQKLINADPLTTASMIRIMHEREVISADLTTIADFLEEADQADAISCLDALFSSIQVKQACGDFEACKALFALLVPSLDVYLRALWIWLESGQLDDTKSFLFIRTGPSSTHDSQLWHNRYFLVERGPSRPPSFLTDLTEAILACGKTASFIRRLSNISADFENELNVDFNATEIIRFAESNPILPFFEAFQSACSEDVNTLLAKHTQTLKALLSSRSGIHQTLDAIENIYLGRNTIVLCEVEPRIFDRIDRCLDGWNDRFQVRDMLETAFGTGSKAHTIDALTIHSTFTSSRSMQNRRGSVKILGALSFEYRLTWPLANIIDTHSMSIYRHVALVLMQIRRARYSLERIGYPTVMTMPLDDEATPEGQAFAQILAFTLLAFINTLYDCLVVSIIQPLCDTMRHEMEAALTVDDMINVHKRYITRLEYACLAAPKLKLLRQSLITILDLCIHFSDLVSNSAKTSSGDSDGEAGSFTSAFSRHRSVDVRYSGSNSESDSDGEHIAEGYSTFIVLEDDTNVVKELRKLKAQYQRQLKFFVSGLKGVGKAGHHVQDLAMLADRLTWIQVR